MNKLLRPMQHLHAGRVLRPQEMSFDLGFTLLELYSTLERMSGDVKPGPLGGDRRSRAVEAHAATILRLFEARRNTTVEELRAALAAEGLRFGYGTLWRFFARRGITRKKRRRTPPSRTATRSIAAAGRGAASAVSGVAQSTDGDALQAQVRRLMNPSNAQSAQDDVLTYIRASANGDQKSADSARDRSVDSLVRTAKVSPDEARTRLQQAAQQSASDSG